MDVVEVAPFNDPAELTAQNANRCILEMISAVAAKRRGLSSLVALAEPAADGKRR
jgi:hypothetical protein